MPGVKASPKKSPSPSKKRKGKQRATTADASSPASSTRSHNATDSPAPKNTTSASPMENGKRAKKEQRQEEDENELLSLAERIAESAHLLVQGRGSDELAQEARDVVKRSFDKGAGRPLRDESVLLLDEMRFRGPRGQARRWNCFSLVEKC